MGVAAPFRRRLRRRGAERTVERADRSKPHIERDRGDSRVKIGGIGQPAFGRLYAVGIYEAREVAWGEMAMEGAPARVFGCGEVARHVRDRQAFAAPSARVHELVELAEQ